MMQQMYLTIYCLCDQSSLMCLQRFGDEKYLKAGKQCAEVLWQRGLLRKGYGLCHGVSGNAYGFLAMYQVTSEPLYLYRATKV